MIKIKKKIKKRKQKSRRRHKPRRRQKSRRRKKEKKEKKRKKIKNDIKVTDKKITQLLGTKKIMQPPRGKNYALFWEKKKKKNATT